MKKIFLLSKANIKLAKEEVLALAGNKKYDLVDNLLIIDSDFDFNRLSYTKAVYDLLFICVKKQIKTKINKFDWQRVYKKSFCIRVFGADKVLEKKFADIVWEKIKNPKVDLKKAPTNVHFFFVKNKVVCCLLKQKISQKDFDLRRAHLRPAMHPSSLHPRLARAMVNLTGIRKGTVIDPFCGTAGILIEAGLMGLNVEGYDIQPEMLDMAEKNLKFFRIKHKLKKADATKLNKKLSYVVSDLPYAKATKTQDLEKLYAEFLKVLKKHLQKKAVLGFPDFIDCKKLIEKSGLEVGQEFAYYLHKSLSKRVVVILPPGYKHQVL